MAFCANCGTDVVGSFCQKCGTPMAASGMGGAGNVPPATGGMTENMAAALTYLLGPITGIIFLMLEPHNRSAVVRFHAWQSILVWAAWIVLIIGLSILSAFLSVFALVLVPVFLLLPLVGFALWLFLMWKAYNNQMFRIPVIADFAAKQAGL